MRQELQGSRHKVFSDQIEIISGYLVITRATGDEGMSDKDMQLVIGAYRW